MLYTSLTRAICLGGMVLFIAACQPDKPSMTAPTAYTTIEPQQLSQKLTTSQYTLIDTRSPDAFNGWTLHGEQRGGHIPGAKLLSADWITRDLPELDTAYQRTGIQPDQSIVVYGYDREQSTVVANWLVSEMGFNVAQISILKGGYNQWAAIKDNPVDHLPGYHSLVPPSALNEQIKSNPQLKVVEIGWDGGKGKAYRKGHIPGALYWDDLEFEHPPIYELNSVEDIRASLLRLGIDKNTPVAVYSTDSIGAARGASVMKYAGVSNVVMLNGGKDAWSAAGLPLDKGWAQPTPVEDFGVTGPGNAGVVIDIEQAKTLRNQHDGALISIRSWEEYVGDISGYGYFQKKGRITGALWGHAGDSAWDMNDYHNPDHTMRNYREIEAFWSQWGIHPDSMELAFYCGNGWRASEVWWYAQAMGYENNQIYSSGWMRWKNDPANPVSKGDITREESLQDWRIATGNAPPAPLISENIDIVVNY